MLDEGRSPLCNGNDRSEIFIWIVGLSKIYEKVFWQSYWWISKSHHRVESFLHLWRVMTARIDHAILDDIVYWSTSPIASDHKVDIIQPPKITVGNASLKLLIFDELMIISALSTEPVDPEYLFFLVLTRTTLFRPSLHFIANCKYEIPYLAQSTVFFIIYRAKSVMFYAHDWKE